MGERDFEAVGDLDHTVGRKHHLDGEQQADGRDGLRLFQAPARIGKPGRQGREDGKHKKHLRKSGAKRRGDSQR